MSKQPVLKIILVIAFISGMSGILVLSLAGCHAETDQTPTKQPQGPVTQSLMAIIPATLSTDSESGTNQKTDVMTLDNWSANGWMLESGVTELIFPVDLEDGANLSFSAGIKSRVSLRSGDIALEVEYTPYRNNPEGASEPGDSVVLIQISLSSHPDILSKWVHMNLPLGSIPKGRGEIRFTATGPLAGSPDVDAMIGNPSIYYPLHQHRKKVLLIGVDTLRRDVLGIYGGNTALTPNIDRLSRGGTIFNRSWSQAPYTGPSFASMLTGCLPAQNSPTVSKIQLPERVTTIGEILGSVGYFTGMICGNPYLGHSWGGFHQGFQSTWFVSNANPHDTIDAAKSFLENQGGRDWFLFLHFMDPHGPYDPPFEIIDSICSGTWSGKWKESFNDAEHNWQYKVSRPPQHEIDRVKCLYDGEVADIDSAIGDLFEYLESSGLLDDTLVIFTADHGEEFYEHGRFSHGQSLFDELVHTPLLVWGDGFQSGTRINTPVGNTDIVPTILQFIGIDQPPGLAGVPLQDVASGQLPNERLIFGEGNLRQAFHSKYALSWPYKCIVNFFTGKIRLYNLEDDPYEKVDIAGDFPEKAEALKRQTVQSMAPSQTTWLVTLIGKPTSRISRVSGIIKLPCGIDSARVLGAFGSDSWDVNGDTVRFNFTPTFTEVDLVKSVMIFPSTSEGKMDISVMADGVPDAGLLYPYGDNTLEPSGHAVVDVYDFPWPNNLPADALDQPFAVRVIGIPDRVDFLDETVSEVAEDELDPELVEQLKALGYIN